jgi:hypothetical protein
MKIIRFDTGNWILTQDEFNYYTPNNDGVIDDCEFHVNSKIRNCDFWIIRGTIQSNLSFVKCPSNNLIFLLDEAYDAAEFPILFLNQFAKVIGPKEVSHNNYLKHHEMFPWLFKGVSFSHLKNSIENNKTKELCIIASDATWLNGHKNRYAFVNKMIGHFKNRIDVYGRGFNSFECKYEILKNYKYSICIENSCIPNYFTEKINECYLAETMPIYYGCPNICEYYDSDSYISINIGDYLSSIDTIENAIANKRWEKNIEKIRLMKIRYLNEFHLPVKLSKLMDHNSKLKPTWNLIIHRKYFENIHLSFSMFNKGFIQIIAKFFVKLISNFRKSK